jgi:hypothetical protein
MRCWPPNMVNSVKGSILAVRATLASVVNAELARLGKLTHTPGGGA